MLITQAFSSILPIKVLDKSNAMKERKMREEREKAEKIDTSVVGDDAHKQDETNSHEGHFLDIKI